jgi:hypothetical protein
MIRSGMTSAHKAPLTLKTINDWNRRFWKAESKLRHKRMSDEAIYDNAQTDMRSETLREVPIKSQKTFEQALADAERVRNNLQSALSRKGGKAAKGDALNRLITKIVRRKLKMNNRQLLFALKKESGQGTIVSIDGESDVLTGDVRQIHFEDDKGTPKTASVAGLKDRLFRAKKKIRANRLAR